MKSIKINPPIYLLIAVIFVIALHFFLPGLTLIPSPWNLLGIIPAVAGLTINLIADQTFHRAETPVSPFDMPSALVTYGPYRFTRNPMYLGFVLILAGVVVLLGSLTPFLVVLAFWLLLDRLFISLEEQKMALKFVARWDMYKSRTRRWL
jgi:protein-S-isoprenylcysteine O-methyltransferase Ste14